MSWKWGVKIIQASGQTVQGASNTIGNNENWEYPDIIFISHPAYVEYIYYHTTPSFNIFWMNF